MEERSGGLTSDDDTASEVKVGKFWTKDQRKKHLEDSKERRRRQEELIKTKSSVTVTSTAGKVKTASSNPAASSPKRHSYHEGSTVTNGTTGTTVSGNKTNEIVLTVATV